jgi:hypothetical protein
VQVKAYFQTLEVEVHEGHAFENGKVSIKADIH